MAADDAPETIADNGGRGSSLATRPRTIVPTASFQPRGIAAVAGGPNPALVNHGGPVLGAVEVVPIYCGVAWSAAPNAQIATQLDGFFDFIVTSSLIDMLGEYSTATTAIGHGRRVSSARIASSEPGAPAGAGQTVSDADIQAALQGWITAGTVATTTANTLYFIYLPPNVVSTMGTQQSCTDYCGYHGNIGGTVFYAVIPYANCNGCAYPGPFLDTLTEVSSHELCEAVTDPTGTTWWDPNPHGQDGAGDEIGDLCNREAVRLGGFLVQQEWSNAQGQCVIPVGAV